ncbi:MAG: integration host factor, actinobacterial type [Acidiferrobacteraceae bacterium]
MATMTVQAPDRSVEQRMAALRRANAVRSARKGMKADLKSGRLAVALLTGMPPSYVLSMKVWDLLTAAPNIGPVKARTLLRRAEIAPSKTVGGLSRRQRDELVGLLVARGRVRTGRT